jgi:hypothetical protein
VSGGARTGVAERALRDVTSAAAHLAVGTEAGIDEQPFPESDGVLVGGMIGEGGQPETYI